MIANIGGLKIIDLKQWWESVASMKHDHKLLHLLKNAGVIFYHGDSIALNRFVKGSTAHLTGVGGIPFVVKDGNAYLFDQAITKGSLYNATTSMMGMAGCFSYLNPKGVDAIKMADICFDHGHYSIAHTVTVNILLAGYSVGVENELNSQRDLVHLSRLTVARTVSQNMPPVVVQDATHLPHYQELDVHLLKLRHNVGESVAGDALESLNLMYPSAKATLSLMTGSLRNIQKLLSARHETSKEKEYSTLLDGIYNILNPIWPEIFRG